MIGFLLTPIIARIYGPGAYGQFAVFTALVSLIQPISTLQLQSGYVAAKSIKQFSALIVISFFMLLLITLALIIATQVLASFGLFFKLSRGAAMILPLYIFLGGLFAIIRGWNIKLEEFKRSSKAKVGATLIGKSSTLGYGWFIGQTEIGLIIGSIATFIVESASYMSSQMRSGIRDIFTIKISRELLIQTLIEFKNYPKYVTTNSIISNFSGQIPIYFIVTWYSTELVGLFSLSLSLITIPVNLVGTSIAAVFLPKISSIIDDDTKRNVAILKLYKKLMYPGFALMFTMSIVLYYILPVLLGSSWQGTGQLASFIAIALTLSIVSIPITVCYRLIHYEKANLSITLLFIIFKVSGLALGLWYESFTLSVLGYFIVLTVQNSFQIIVLFKKLRIPIILPLRDISILISIYILAYLIIY